MNPPPRTPVVLGAGPRTGASTIATALHAHDGGVRDTAADIVVCAATEESLRRAETLAVAGTRPLLAVVLLDGGPAPMRSRLRSAGMRYAAVTVLPHVEAWAGLVRPAEDDVATLLGRRPDHLPAGHRAYATALRAMTAALLGTGLLDRSQPPVVVIATPRSALSAAPGPPPAPVRRPIRLAGVRDLPPSARMLVPPPYSPPATSVRTGVAFDDLDDEALEHAVALLGTR